MNDGRLGVVDFGLVARLPDGLPSAMGRLIRLAIRNDKAAMTSGLAAEGFIAQDVDASECGREPTGCCTRCQHNPVHLEDRAVGEIDPASGPAEIERSRRRPEVELDIEIVDHTGRRQDCLLGGHGSGEHLLGQRGSVRSDRIRAVDQVESTVVARLTKRVERGGPRQGGTDDGDRTHCGGADRRLRPVSLRG